MSAGVAPFAQHLQCLSCGSKWWSNPEAPISCPKCRPTRSLGPDGQWVTTYQVAIRNQGQP